MAINLCTNCQHNYQGLDCIKDKLVFPNAQACTDVKSKTMSALVVPIQPVVTTKVIQTSWRIMARDEPTKCVFNAYLP